MYTQHPNLWKAHITNVSEQASDFRKSDATQDYVLELLTYRVYEAAFITHLWG